MTVTLSLVDWLRQYSEEQTESYDTRILRKNVILWRRSLKKAQFYQEEKKFDVCYHE